MSEKAPDLSLRNGHRERLRQNFLDDKLAKYEILELMLAYVIPRRDVRPLARLLYKKFGGIYAMLSASIDELTTVPGMGRNTAIFIKVIQKIMLMGYESQAVDKQTFLNKTNLDNFCKLMLGGQNIEELHVLYLDGDGRLLYHEKHSQGTWNQTSLYKGEILKTAIRFRTQNVVLIHNHPKPNTSFSAEDFMATHELAATLRMVGIQLVDHYVVSGGILYSMREFTSEQF